MRTMGSLFGAARPSPPAARLGPERGRSRPGQDGRSARRRTWNGLPPTMGSRGIRTAEGPATRSRPCEDGPPAILLGIGIADPKCGEQRWLAEELDAIDAHDRRRARATGSGAPFSR